MDYYKVSYEELSRLGYFKHCYSCDYYTGKPCNKISDDNYEEVCKSGQDLWKEKRRIK